jgi:hypothetical protein
VGVGVPRKIRRRRVGRFESRSTRRGVENIQAQRAIARNRRRYAELTPDARVVLAQPTDNISEEALAMIGVRPGRLLLPFTIASTVGAVNAVVAGIGSVLLITWLVGAAATPLAVATGQPRISTLVPSSSRPGR